MSEFSVAFHAVGKSSETAARSMLRLLLPMLGNRWRMGEAATADLVILDPAALEQLNLAGRTRADALYSVFANAAEPPANAFCVLHKPLTSARLIEALNQAQAELERRRSAVSPTTALPSDFGAESGASGRAIQTSIRAAVAQVLQDDKSAITVLSAGDTKILSALPGRGFTTRLTGTEIAVLMRRNEPAQVVILTEDEQQALAERKRDFEPLAKLDWIYWITGKGGELRPELHVSKLFRLKQWPDFGRLPHYRADVRLATMLKAGALTVGQLAERAGVRMETAVNFINGCAALGVLAGAEPRGEAGKDKSADSSDRPPPQSARSAGLLGSLRSALGLVRQ